MPINEVRVKAAAEPKIPLFLMTPKEEKSGTSRRQVEVEMLSESLFVEGTKILCC
jgi:hypothetical protein